MSQPACNRAARGAGRRWKWSKTFRTTNYFQKHSNLGNKKWKKYYGSITRDHILFFFGLTEQYFMKHKATQQLKLNKLLLWINFLHSEHQTWFDFSRKWGDICESTVSNYMMDVACAILRAFASTPKIIGFQSQQNIEKMKKILSDSKAAIPYATYLVDGKCTRVL